MNLVVLQGNIGADPVVTNLESGSKCAVFSVATTERGFKTADGKEIPDRTEWTRVVTWNGLAGIAEKFLKKGSNVTIQGKLQTRSWEDDNGVKRYVTEVVAEKLTLPPKGNGGAGNVPPPAEAPEGKTASTSKTVSTPKTETKSTPASAPVVSDDGDDLPF